MAKLIMAQSIEDQVILQSWVRFTVTARLRQFCETLVVPKNTMHGGAGWMEYEVFGLKVETQHCFLWTESC